MKVHKTPLKTRPIVSFSGSLYHSLGVWIDTHLQHVAKSFPSYIKSSFDLLRDFRNLNLPRGCKLFTADATSMYTNINTEIAISAIHDYIVSHQALFPLLPVTPLTEALQLLMRHNIFQFGDTFCEQLSGTAMGAPPAPTYANASFATHEAVLLPQYTSQLAYYKRYIDDIFGIWIPHPDPSIDAQLWTQFQHDLNNWHGLQWVVSCRSNNVIFLDLHLELRHRTIFSKLYEKPMNLHLYLPARSAHPPGVLHGLIAGHIYRAFCLCTDPSDAHASVSKLFQHLLARGYYASVLKPIFENAFKNRQNFTPSQQTDSSFDCWIFKLTYHPQDPSSRLIQQAWQDTVAAPRLSKPLERIDIRYNPIGHRRFIVCYKRPPNIGNLLSYRKLQPTSGPPVSSFSE